jgi:hypothetical protein
VFRVPSALQGNLRCSTLDLAQIVGRKLDGGGCDVRAGRLVAPIAG